MGMPSGRARRLAVLALAVVLASATAACTPKQSPHETPTPNTSLHAPSPAASSPDPRAEVQKAVAAYTNLLNAYAAASNSGTTDTTELSKYATGSALQLLSKGLADNKAKGLHSQGTPGIDPPHVTEISPVNDPTTVEVTGCVDDTHWQLYNSSGQLVDSGPSGRRPTSAQIDRSGGVWKVSSLAIQGVGTCPG
jgi:predicted lipid-binding transport protein (Tim44 family)